MTMLPHRAIHLIALGQEARLRLENTVWLCVGCFTCATRCPNAVDIPGIFDRLRARWTLPAQECPSPDTRSFHVHFLRDVKRRGRVHELRVLGEHYLAIRHPLREAPLAWRLLRKGRLRLAPPRRVKGFHRWIASQQKDSLR
jgi:heterodisulfide reductase subunit C